MFRGNTRRCLFSLSGNNGRSSLLRMMVNSTRKALLAAEKKNDTNARREIGRRKEEEENEKIGTGSGYRYFEDQYPPHDPAPAFEYYEDQVMGATAKRDEPKKQLDEGERIRQQHQWVHNKHDGTFRVPENFAWEEQWGPEPGEDGHAEWYKKDRMYMSSDEKFKADIGLQRPVKEGEMRHFKFPLHKRIEAAYQNLQEKNPKMYSTKDKNWDADYSMEEKGDYMVKARNEYMREWLEKPGVTPQNISKKIAEYHGMGENIKIKAAPRKPEWELAPPKMGPE